MLAAFPAMAASPGTTSPCAAVAGARPPPSDLPTPKDRQELHDCVPEKLYWGIGQVADPARARLCAFTTRAADMSNTPDPAISAFSADQVLMTIYANGIGAARNLRYALHLACGLPETNAALIADLAAKGQTSWAGRNFAFCDDAVTTTDIGACALHTQMIAHETSRKAFDLFAAKLSPDAAPLFAVLRAAQSAWAQARSRQEVGFSGTLRAVYAFDEEERQDQEFADMLGRMEEPPSYIAPSQYHAAEARLNQIMNQIAAGPEDVPDNGTVTKAAIQQTQAAWIRYRDAWADFAAEAYPDWNPRTITAILTIKRANMLAIFLHP